MRRLAWLLVLAWAVPLWAQPAPAGDGTPQIIKPDAVLPERRVEVDLGERKYSQKEDQEGSKEVEQFYGQQGRVYRDPRLQSRLETILHRVVTAAAELGPKQICIDDAGAPPLTFSIRVLATDEINAFSAWGGSIFVTRGMIDFCQSDDELAGVIAHEVAHTTYHHLREQAARLRRYQTQQLLAMIAAGFMGINVADAGLMAQYVYLALFNGHSVTAEEEADKAGVYYAQRAGYNPVGMITTFERLHRWQMTQPVPTDLGAFQTHPWSDERARSLESQLKQLDLPINRRQVTYTVTAMVRTDAADQGTYTLVASNVALLKVAASGGQEAGARAADLAAQINLAVGGGLRGGSLGLRADDQGSWLIFGLNGLRGVDLLKVTPADGALAGQDTQVLANAVLNRLRAAFRQAEVEAGVA